MNQISRRSLIGAAAGLVVSFSLPRQSFAGPHSVATDEVDGFLSVGPDGAVTVFSGKVDIGTGARAALRQIVAEELGASLDRIRLIEGDTALTPDQGSTGGSTGISVGGTQIRHAAATARVRLLALAATKLSVPPDRLEAVDNVVRPIAGGDGISFAALVGGQDFAQESIPPQR